MARANIGNWSGQYGKERSVLDWWPSEHPHAATARRKSEVAKPPEERKPARPGRRAMALLNLFRKESGELPKKKTKGPGDTKDEPPPIEQPPNTGRATPIGRRVERPADDSVAGPSGQKDRVHHDRKHANK